MPPGRRRASGPGRREKQHKRAAATYGEKLAVVRHYEWSRDMPLTVKEFHPALEGAAARAKARLFYRWVQQKETIAARADSAKTSRQARVRRVGVATTLGTDGERELVAWLRAARRRGDRVSADLLRARALEVARARNVPEGVFAGSSTWQKGFLERHRHALAQDDSGDDDADAAAEDDDAGVEDAEDDERDAAEIPNDDYECDDENAGHSVTSESDSELHPHISSSPESFVEAAVAAAAAPRVELAPAATAAAAASGGERGRKAPRRARVVALVPPSTASTVSQLSSDQTPKLVTPRALRANAARRAVLLSPVAQHVTSPVTAASSPDGPVNALHDRASPAAPPAVVTLAIDTAVEASASPVRVVATVDEEERALRWRRAEIEERKAELLNESIRYDNVLKRIKIAEENALARKRLKDAGVAQEEIDALLPLLRE